MNKNEIQELISDFILETDEIIELLDQNLVELENRKNDLDLLNQIFRGAHTIKGSASFLNFTKLAEVTHHAEEVLNKLRKAELSVSTNVMDVLLEFVDVVKGLMLDIKKGTDTVNIDSIVKKLTLVNNGNIVHKTPQSEVVNTASVAQSSNTEKQDTEISKAKKSNNGKRDLNYKQEQTIRVDVARLDGLMNLVGELVLGRNRMMQVSTLLEKKFEDEEIIEQLAETVSHLGLITSELQIAVMKTRMISIGKIFNKFPRMIRDLSREKNKEIDIVLSGEDTEMDKTIVDAIGDPLIHMIRNSIDHAIEMPEEREMLGKPRRGTISLSAYYEGNNILIEISDDGKGIDTNIIKAKAIEKRIITPEEAAELSPDAIYALIFRPGFSTASKITNISGRGVGMDVVKTNVEMLQGTIQVESAIDKGTTFRIRLPLTLAIIQALFVDVAGENFAIPLSSVIETVNITTDEIHSFEGHEVLKLRDSVLSLLRLDTVFDLDGIERDESYVVVVGIAEKRVGLIVDNLIGQEEIVIKSLGEYLSSNVGIAGATIMGDGHVRLIIDVAGVINLAKTTPRRVSTIDSKLGAKNIAVANRQNFIDILHVDDSAMDRKIMRNILESTGWIRYTGVASADYALLALNKKSYDLVVTDLFMPNKDGYELALELRALGIKTPIIAVSARTEASDRKKIADCGMNAFITKPINLHDMVDKINELVS